MIFKLTPLVMLLSIMLVPAGVRAEPDGIEASKLSSGDFAYVRNLTVHPGASLYAAELPEELYRDTTREDLGDLRIFNGSGLVVPHEIEQARPESERVVSSSELPFFPIEGATRGGAIGNAVQVAEDPSGRVVSVRFTGEGVASAEADKWYLVDVRSLPSSLQALTFRVSNLANNLIVPVDIEVSEDLQTWSRISSSGVLARLNYQGQDFERARITFVPQRPKYLKVRFGTKEAVTLLGIAGELVTLTETLPDEQWTTISGALQPKSARTVVFDAGHHLPVRSLRVQLPLVNSMLRVRIDSRPRESSAWVSRFSGALYRLSAAAGEIESQTQALGTTVTDRFWRIKIEGKDVSLGENLPLLRLGWRPARVVFLAQGQGPFQLAYGSALVGAPDFGVRNLAGSSSSNISLVQVGEVLQAGGAEKLIAPVVTPELPWKQWLLWAVLGAFLVIVALMAHRLWKDLQKS